MPLRRRKPGICVPATRPSALPLLLAAFLAASLFLSGSYAADAGKPSEKSEIKRDESVASKCKINKAKIAEERDAIIADGQQLREIRKTGDKVRIEEATKEIEQDIARRKALIKALYKDMGVTNKVFDIKRSREKKGY